jgi:nucleotide-binding universal stress UspA family protein
MLTRILVPLDGSEQSEQIIGFCSPLAKAAGSAVTLLHVIDPNMVSFYGLADLLPTGPDLVANERNQALAYLHGVQTRLSDLGLDVEIHVMLGVPAEAIVSYAQERGAGLIAMSTHGRSGVARWALGSVADRVLHTAATPLLLYKPQREATPSVPAIRRVLLPLDGSPLAEQARPLAALVAKALSVSVEVVRVLDLGHYGVFTTPYQEGNESAGGLWRMLVEEAETELAAAVRALTDEGVSAEPRLLRGDPASRLIELAHRTQGSLIVMTTHGRSGMERLLLGSVAEKVVRGAECPVLMVPAALVNKEQPLQKLLKSYDGSV